MSLRGNVPVPTAPVPLLPLRTGVLFPGALMNLAVGRPRSVALLRTLHPGDLLVTFTQEKAKTVDPSEADLHRSGTYARIVRLVRRGEEEYQLLVEGLGRAALSAVTREHPFYQAEVTHVPDECADTAEARALAAALRAQVSELVAKDGGALAEITARDDEPGTFADQVASQLNLPVEAEIEILQARDVAARLRLVARMLGEARTTAEVKARIEDEVRKEVGKTQREHVLREQMKAIKKELGDEGGDELSALRDRLDAAGLSPEARKVADRELAKLERANGPETNVIRNYLELIADLPWSRRADAKDDLGAIEAKLAADHHGLEDVKKRVLEHMAVLSLSRNHKGSILCLVGPPGVGKTSLGQSIADATGRPLARVALGGVRDEAEIRGHRRTYVGALPGRILHALKKAGVKNPLLLLDEIDKTHAGWAGSPESALLEVLDPEQNGTFTDHYLEIPFDLSEVMFLCTANTLEPLSAPLRDRLEIVELSGYTPDEKLHIARKHVLPRRLGEHGLDPASVVVEDATIEAIVRDYTREAGVRQLDRELSRLCRAAALDIARRAKGGGDEPVRVVFDPGSLRDRLGRPRYEDEVRERTASPGVATGLAWTPFGGSILFIETSRMPGKGHVEITGQLGDVMKESARAALSYVRSNAASLGVPADVVQAEDVHIHVPQGAVPKDGPSAGVTIFTALVSLFTGRRVRPDTAMTGECTLRGRVLPVGGIKAKILAAHRAGISRVIVPKKCARDLDDVPKEVASSLEIILVEDMAEVLAAALDDGPAALPAAPLSPSPEVISAAPV